MTRGKKILSIVLSALLLAGGTTAQAAGGATLPTAAEVQETGGRFAMPELALPAKEAILIEQETGQVLYEKNADDRVPIASITKVMTLPVSYTHLDVYKRQATGRLRAWSAPSRCPPSRTVSPMR